jgi:hypothetical protein
VSGHGLRGSVAPPVSIVTTRIENPVLFIELCQLGMQLARALDFDFRMSALATMRRHSDSQLIFQKVKVALILRFLAISILHKLERETEGLAWKNNRRSE